MTGLLAALDGDGGTVILPAMAQEGWEEGRELRCETCSGDRGVVGALLAWVFPGLQVPWKPADRSGLMRESLLEEGPPSR